MTLMLTDIESRRLGHRPSRIPADAGSMTQPTGACHPECSEGPVFPARIDKQVPHYARDDRRHQFSAPQNMRILEGDLLALAMTGEFDVIVHGCNCMHTMGAGIAKAIKQQFPEAFAADTATPKGRREKLGTTSVARIVRPSATFSIVNAYTQFDWRGAGTKADYDAIRNAMIGVKTNFSGLRIGYPLIGAGLAGGDWKIIAPIIDEALAGEDHTLVRYAP